MVTTTLYHKIFYPSIINWPKKPNYTCYNKAIGGNNMVNIIKSFAPYSKCRPMTKRTGTIGVTIHNTGNSSFGAGAVNHALYLQGAGSNHTASWHYCVDDTCITQSIPEDEVAYHAGDGKGNGNYKTISIEICMNQDSDILVATNNAVDLCVNILTRYNLTANDIYMHYDWSGKNCPVMLRQGIPYTFKNFKLKVEQKMEEIMTRDEVIKIVEEILQPKDQDPSSWAKEEWADAKHIGLTDGTNPKSYATREQVAAMIMRSLNC